MFHGQITLWGRPESSGSSKERWRGSKERENRKEEARQKRKLLESELRNDLEHTNKNLKLSNELLKDRESELGSLMKAEKVNKKKLLSASVKISTSLKCCAKLQSEKKD